MNAQLKELLGSRSSLEIKSLYDRLRDIRGEMNARGLFTSSMHVNEVIRACSDYIENFGNSSLDDYKRAISVGANTHHSVYLSGAAADFLDCLSVEKCKVRGILDSSIGGIAHTLSNKGLQDYQAFDVIWESVSRKAKAEAEIFNAGILEKKPSLLSLLKEKWQSHPVVVVIIVTGAAIVFLSGIADSVKKLAGIFN